MSTLTMAMCMPVENIIGRGLAMGSWGAAQATSAGIGIALGGVLKDVVGEIAMSGGLGVGLRDPVIGYMFVYHFEILLIFITLATLGPLAQQIKHSNRAKEINDGNFGLAEIPT